MLRREQVFSKCVQCSFADTVDPDIHVVHTELSIPTDGITEPSQLTGTILRVSIFRITSLIPFFRRTWFNLSILSVN